jgi:predicted glycosyltransferase
MGNRIAALAARPTLLFYCQHSLGIGHLTRSFALASALAEFFHVVLLNGGPLPPELPVPSDIEIVHLPPLGMDDGHTIVSRAGSRGVAQAQAERRVLIDAAVARHRPAVLLIELFPFGRKKFAAEIVPLIRAARRQPGAPALVACSLRDILVARANQQRHDDRARWWADRYFDAVFVHADPRLARLEESFHPRRPLRVPVHYTGYVVPDRSATQPVVRGEHVLVSAGGGIVGEPLFRAALAARALRPGLALRIVAGPFLPEAHWQALQQSARGTPGVELVRQVPDMVAEMRRARASISQCGYNSALDIVVSGVPALVVPYATSTENEQSERAVRLAGLGALRHMNPESLTGPQLAAQIDALLAFRPCAAALDLTGAAHTARTLHVMHTRRSSAALKERATCVPA